MIAAEQEVYQGMYDLFSLITYIWDLTWAVISYKPLSNKLMVTLIQRVFEDSFVLKEKTGKNKPKDQQDDVILLNTSKRMKYFLIL